MALIVSDMRGLRTPLEQEWDIMHYGYRIDLDATELYHLYCCNDSMITREVFDKLYDRVAANEDDLRIYNAGLAFQAFALTLALRGVLVDEKARVEALKFREGEELEAIEKLRRDPEISKIWDVKEPWQNARDGYCLANPKKLSIPSNHAWSPRGVPPEDQQCLHCAVSRMVVTPLNPHSSPQMAKLFYDKLGMQVRRSRKTGEATTDNEAINALADKYPDHAQICDRVLDARKAHKQVALLKSKLDPDGRWRQSLNIAAAETGRTSSSQSPYRTGGNLQNIADRSRNIFIPDPGLEFFYADLEQAESNIVGHDAECPQDIEDHASGDTHTGLARTIFPHLPWGVDGKSDKEVAATPLPWDPEHDHRHVAKIVRHGTNIGMTWVGIQRALHCTAPEAKGYLDAYFARYPEILARQREIRREVKTTKTLTTPLGRTRLFLGRPWDESTMKEALAQTQQSTIGDQLNTAAWRVFYELDTQLNLGRAPRLSDPNRVWLLGQIHDAILGLYRPGDNDTLQRVRAILETPIIVRGNPVLIKCEILIGPNWRKADMRKWKPE